MLSNSAKTTQLRILNQSALNQKRKILKIALGNYFCNPKNGIDTVS